MRRHINYYSFDNQSSCRVLRVDRGNMPEIVVYFDETYYNDVKLYNWSYKGKNGIMNEFNVSLGAFLAEKVGYKAGNWKRIHKDGDYRATNFTVKINGADAARLAQIRPKLGENVSSVPCFPRKRWISKYTCEDLTLEVVTPMTHIPVGVITIQVNTCYRHYVPTKILLKNGELVCIGTGETLASKLLKDAGCDPQGKIYCSSWFNRRHELDYRIDPNNMSYVDTPNGHIRKHSVDIPSDNVDDAPTSAVIFEYRERSQSTIGWHNYWLPANKDEQFRIPLGATAAQVNLDGTRVITCHERTSFVMVDANLANGIVEVYYNGKNDEFYAKTTDDEDSFMLLKRYVAEKAGMHVKNTYIPSRMTKAYAKAMEKSGDKGSGDRRRAVYENRAMDEKGHKCFIDGKHLTHRKVIATKSYFCTSIYGGVGVWVKDLRACSIHVKVDVETIRHRDNA